VNGKVELRSGGFALDVPGGSVPGLDGRRVVAGLRPEHLELGEAGSGAATLDATVDVVEYLGDELIVHLQAGDVAVVAKLPVEQRLASGSQVHLALPVDRLHLFDAESGQALTA
jgi:ABC-type sugar transport system ATPase subunit